MYVGKGAGPGSCRPSGDFCICYGRVSPSTIIALLVFFEVCLVIKLLFIVNPCVE